MIYSCLFIPNCTRNHVITFTYSVITGECWAGHKSKNNYMSLGEADPDMCLGDDYKNCGKFDRFCAGKLWANMVYEIGKLCYCPA